MELTSVIQQKILSFYYHLTRKGDLVFLERKMRELLRFLQRKKGVLEPFEYKEFVKLLWILMVETRDLDSGKGERDHAYMMLYVWYDYFPLLSLWMLKIILGGTVGIEGESLPRFGCWKDVKHLCQYVWEKSGSENHPLILEAVDLVLKELRSMVYENKHSLVAKWIPREKTKYHWLFCKMATDWSPGYSPLLYKKKKFRVLLSRSNRSLEILETFQCSRQWSNIQPHHINSSGLYLKQSLFREGGEGDAAECSQRLNESLYSESFFHPSRTYLKNGSPTLSKLNHIPIEYYVKRALDLIQQGKGPEEKDVLWLNKMWAHHVLETRALSYFLPVVSVDKFVQDDSFYFSVGLACLMSEKSMIPKRILLFVNGSPLWFSAGVDCPDFFSWMVSFHQVLENLSLFPEGIESGMTLLIQSMLQTKMAAETIEKMVLVCINVVSKAWDTSLHRLIVDVFLQQGISWDHMPHMVYWNVSLPDTTPLPCSVSDHRASILSGRSSSLLRYFFLFQLKIIRNMNPFDVLSFQMNPKRYYPLRLMFDRIVSPETET